MPTILGLVAAGRAEQESRVVRVVGCVLRANRVVGTKPREVDCGLEMTRDVPPSLDEAVTWLRDEQINRRKRAADWLNLRAPDPTRQKEVAQALEPLHAHLGAAFTSVANSAAARRTNCTACT